MNLWRWLRSEPAGLLELAVGFVAALAAVAVLLYGLVMGRLPW